MSEIKFTASVYKVQTNVSDMGVRVTLELPEDAIPEMAMLAECRRQGIPLVFTAKVDNDLINKQDHNYGPTKGNHQQSKRATA